MPLASIAGPLCISSRTTASCPPSTAQYNAVRPVSVVASRCAPASRSKPTIVSFPSAAAICNAVHRKCPVALTFAFLPLLKSTRTAFS
ncbi:hypothetical protein BGZ60DRAFT_421515 [Tricladium varicosporioides]|nr:hypothetical protein BGZ60DRAFT_421515 [Hymenoscyphus varicosporioides]